MEFNNIEELKTKLKEVSDKEFIESHRENNTGIGKTLEDEMDIDENNLAEGDFKLGDNLVELKAQRKTASSRVTLSTKEPTWIINKFEVINETGYLDSKNRTALKITLNTLRFNPKGFKLEIKDNRVVIVHERLGDVCYFDIDALMEIIKRKLGNNLLFVLADVEKRDDKEFFHYSEAIYFSDFYEEKFKELIETGQIIWEFRLHLNSPTNIRDHGSGFRISRRYLGNLFENKETLISEEISSSEE